MNKNTSQSGFILMLVIMIAIVLAIAFFAFKRISDARSSNSSAETSFVQIK